jgi:hypothetical protein
MAEAPAVRHDVASQHGAGVVLLLHEAYKLAAMASDMSAGDDEAARPAANLLKAKVSLRQNHQFLIMMEAVAVIYCNACLETG